MLEIDIKVSIGIDGLPISKGILPVSKMTPEEVEALKVSAMKDIRRVLRRANEAGDFDELGSCITLYDVQIIKE